MGPRKAPAILFGVAPPTGSGTRAGYSGLATFDGARVQECRNMDDLAGLVVKQLRLDDGPGPLVMVHISYNRKRMMVAKAKRTNGVVHYELAHVDVAKEHYHVTHEGEHRVKWDFVNYTDVNAAAYFGMAFMRDIGQRETENPETRMMRNANTHKLFEPGPDGALLLPITHNRGMGYGITHYTEMLGTATNPDKTTFAVGLCALMPTSVPNGDRVRI